MTNHRGVSSQTHETELLQLLDVSGIKIQPEIVRILIQLLDMNIHPSTVFVVLLGICSKRVRKSRIVSSTHKSSSKSEK